MASQIGKVIPPTFPSGDCHTMCRVDPFNCQANCLKMGKSLSACRNPVGARPSQTRQMVYSFAGTADAAGLIGLRLFPVVSFPGLMTYGSLAGAAPGQQVSLPNYSALLGIASSFRIAGWGVKLVCNQSAMNNQGKVYVATERPNDPTIGARPTPSDVYISGLPGYYTGQFKDGCKMAGGLGRANFVTSTGPFAQVIWDTLQDYQDLEATHGTGLVGAGTLGDLMDTLVIYASGLQPTASYTLELVLNVELVMKSTFDQADHVLTTSPGTSAMSTAIADAGKAAHTLSSVISGGWSAIKMATEAAGMVPGLADGAAVAKDLEAGVDVGTSALHSAWSAASSLWKAFHG